MLEPLREFGCAVACMDVLLQRREEVTKLRAGPLPAAWCSAVLEPRKSVCAIIVQMMQCCRSENTHYFMGGPKDSIRA